MNKGAKIPQKKIGYIQVCYLIFLRLPIGTSSPIGKHERTFPHENILGSDQDVG